MASAWVQKHKGPNGVSYLLRWEYQINGVRHRGSENFGRFKNLAEEKKVLKLKELTATRAGLDVAPTEIIWDAFAEQFLRFSKTHFEPRTSSHFHAPAVVDFGKWFGNRPLSAIRPADIGVFTQNLGDRLGATTVGMRLRSLHTALEWAKSQGYISIVPPCPQPRVAPVGRVLSDAELARLFANLPPLTRPASMFAVHTGVRAGELIALTWERVRQAAGGGHWEAEIYSPKTHTSRVIPLHPGAVDALGAPNSTGVVFKMTQSWVTHAITKAARKANLGRVRLHDLRHTWATRYMQATGDLFGLMTLGGWRSLQSVARYQHLTKTRSESINLLKFPTISPQAAVFELLSSTVNQ